jgi:hypothetical protein
MQMPAGLTLNGPQFRCRPGRVRTCADIARTAPIMYQRSACEVPAPPDFESGRFKGTIKDLFFQQLMFGGHFTGRADVRRVVLAVGLARRPAQPTLTDGKRRGAHV